MFLLHNKLCNVGPIGRITVVAYLIPLLYLLYKFTHKYEYPLAVTIIVLLIFSNILIFTLYSSTFVCVVSIIICNIAFVIALIYLLVDIKRNNKDKKH